MNGMALAHCILSKCWQYTQIKIVQDSNLSASKHLILINLLRNCPETSPVCHQAVCTVKGHCCTELCSLKLVIRNSRNLKIVMQLVGNKRHLQM